MERKDGYGTYNFANGAKYVGTWKDDKRDGTGVFNLSHGDTYNGEFKDGMMHGKGKFTSADGDIFEGTYEFDKICGDGRYTWVDGSMYEGGLLDGKKQGKGYHKFCSGDEYTGDFMDDKMDGYGVYKFANGDRYEGQVRDDQLYGTGKFIFANGQVYEGVYKRDGALGDSNKKGGISGKFANKSQEDEADDEDGDGSRPLSVAAKEIIQKAAEVAASVAVAAAPPALSIGNQVVRPEDVDDDEQDDDEGQDGARCSIIAQKSAILAQRLSLAVDDIVSELASLKLDLANVSAQAALDGEVFEDVPAVADAAGAQSLVDDKLPVPPMHCGYMDKLGGSILKNWKNRYFVLNSTERTCKLTYYEKSKDTPPFGVNEKGILDLKGRLLDIRGGYLVLVGSGREKGEKKIFKMSCKEPALKSQWVDALNAHIAYSEQL